MYRYLIQVRKGDVRLFALYLKHMYDAEEMAKRGRPPLEDRGSVKTKLFMLRLTEEEAAEFKEAAERDKQNVSEWLRGLGRARAKRLKRK